MLGYQTIYKSKHGQFASFQSDLIGK